MTPDRELTAELEAMVLAPEYPCVGAKSVFRRRRAVVRELGDMTEPQTGRELAAALRAFGDTYADSDEFASFVATFSGEQICDEEEFEQAIWTMLQSIHEADPRPWNRDVSPDPDNPHFGFSVGGHAFFIVGMHPGASRIARRTPVPVAVFNLHAQFERLRERGGFDRMRDTIRKRDTALQGSLNPNVADHGSVTEARQYAGRAVEPDWEAPFQADPDQVSGDRPAAAS